VRRTRLGRSPITHGMTLKTLHQIRCQRGIGHIKLSGEQVVKML
jgi:hypothetical protein